MPDRIEPKANPKPEFHESLTPAMPLVVTDTTTMLRSPMIGMGLWILTVLLVGIGFGLAIRTHASEAPSVGAPGLVATVTDPAGYRIPEAVSLAAPVAASPNLATIELGGAATADKLVVSPTLGTGTLVQATLATDSLYYAGDANSLQPGFSIYGTQGSVGIAADR